MEDDSDSEEKVIETAAPEGEPAVGVSVKFYKHIAPRLDPDNYQCPVPDKLLEHSLEEADGKLIFLKFSLQPPTVCLHVTRNFIGWQKKQNYNAPLLITKLTKFYLL